MEVLDVLLTQLAALNFVLLALELSYFLIGVHGESPLAASASELLNLIFVESLTFHVLLFDMILEFLLKFRLWLWLNFLILVFVFFSSIWLNKNVGSC